MAALRTLEDFVRQRLSVDRRMRLHVFATKDGRWQANLERADKANAYAVEIDGDPVTAIWNVVAPYQMRRTLPSGREVVLGDRPLLIPEPEPDLLAAVEDVDLLADDDELDLLA